MVAHAVFGSVGVVGMRGAEHIAHILIILRVLIGVAHDKTDGAACGFAFEHSTKQFHLVGFLPARRDCTLSRTATVKVGLNEVEVDVYASRHSVNHSSNCLTMTLAERRKRKDITVSITHNYPLIFQFFNI